jgi:hypothetical protein
MIDIEDASDDIWTSPAKGKRYRPTAINSFFTVKIMTTGRLHPILN